MDVDQQLNTAISYGATSILAAALALTLLSPQAAAEDAIGPFLQVYLGVTELDDQTSNWTNGNNESIDVDFSSLPTAGFELEYLFEQGFVHWGINPGGSVSWKNKDMTFSGSLTRDSGGTITYTANNSLLLAELHLGGYLRGRINDRITTYLSAGPMILYGYHDVEDETYSEVASSERPQRSPTSNNSDSSDVKVGVYGRAGFDFEIGDNRYLGLGIRYISAELDFDRTIGKIDIRGPQYLLTYSARL